MNPLFPPTALRAQNRCEYCRAPGAAFNFSFEVEHILPVFFGGSDALDNLALACRACNAFKSARQTGTDPETGQSVPLFHPRQQIWNDHFQFAPTENTLIGLTPTGRATAAMLRFNSAEQQTARRMWMRLELFP